MNDEDDSLEGQMAKAQRRMIIAQNIHRMQGDMRRLPDDAQGLKTCTVCGRNDGWFMDEKTGYIECECVVIPPFMQPRREPQDSGPSE